MNKATLIRRLTAENNGKIFITQSQAIRLLGMGKTSFREMMDGYDYRICGKGNAKQYLVDDVAEAVIRS